MQVAPDLAAATNSLRRQWRTMTSRPPTAPTRITMWECPWCGWLNRHEKIAYKHLDLCKLNPASEPETINNAEGGTP